MPRDRSIRHGVVAKMVWAMKYSGRPRSLLTLDEKTKRWRATNRSDAAKTTAAIGIRMSGSVAFVPKAVATITEMIMTYTMMGIVSSAGR